MVVVGPRRWLLDTMVMVNANPAARRSWPALLALLIGTSCSSTPAWTELFDGERLGDWTIAEFGGEGPVTVRDSQLILGQGWSLTGVTWKGAALPEFDYEVEVRGAKLKGDDFFAAITFPVGKGFCSLVLGGWGGNVVGISSIDGMDADSNPTRRLIDFDHGRSYEIRIQVTRQAITAWIDKVQVLTHEVPGFEFTVRGEVIPTEPFGIASYETESAFSRIRWRPLR